MGNLLELVKYDFVLIQSNSENNGNNDVPHEYPYPCPFLTPENLGYSRPNPYPYLKY